MKTSLVQIGNSRGIRLPKRLIEQCRFQKNVRMQVQGTRLIISAIRTPRAGWKAALAASGPAPELITLPASQWDAHEWEW